MRRDPSAFVPKIETMAFAFTQVRLDPYLFGNGSVPFWLRYKSGSIWVCTCIGTVRTMGGDSKGYDNAKRLFILTLCTHVPIVITFADIPHDGFKLDQFPHNCNCFWICSCVNAVIIVPKRYGSIWICTFFSRVNKGYIFC